MESEICERIRKLRVENNFSQVSMGILLKLSQPGYSKKETGKVRFSELEIRDISEIFRVSSDYILFGKDMNNEKE